MLRKFHIARLAFQHSPEREQRLLCASQTNDDGIQKPVESGDSPSAWETEKLPEGVSSIASGVKASVLETVPEQLLENISAGDIVDVLESSGVLSEEFEAEIRALGISDLDRATPEKKKQLVQQFLRARSESELMALVSAIQSRLGRHEELMGRVERGIKRLFQAGADPTALEKAIAAVTKYEHKDHGEVEGIPANSLFNEKNVLKALNIGKRYSPEEREKILAVLYDIAEANRIRRSFGQRPDTKDDPKERREARTKFLHNLNENSQSLTEYADARLGARANMLQEKMKSLAEKLGSENSSDEGFFRKYDLTVDGVKDAFDNIRATLRSIRRETVAEDHAKKLFDRPLPGAPKYAEHTAAAIRKMDEIDQSFETVPGTDLPKFLEAKREEERAVEAWGRDASKRLDALSKEDMASHPKARMKLQELCEFFAPFIDGSETIVDITSLRQTTSPEQEDIDATIALLEMNPGEFEKRDSGPREKVSLVDNVDAIIEESRERLARALNSVTSHVSHPVCEAFGIPTRLETLEKGALADLQTGVSVAVNSAQEKIASLERCGKILASIASNDSDFIVRIDDPADYRSIARVDSFAFYEYSSGRIYLNTTKIAERGKDETEVLRHERGHAVLDAFRRSGVFPVLLTTVYDAMRNRVSGSGRSFRELLAAQAAAWDIDLSNPEEPTKEEVWKLIDELANRYAEWTGAGQPDVGNDLRELFDLFGAGKAELPEKEIELSGGVHMSDDGVITADKEANESDTEPDTQTHVEGEMGLMDKYILDADEFLRAYPEYTDEAESEFAYSRVKEIYAERKKEFRSGAYKKNPGFVEDIKTLRKVMKLFIDGIKDIDRQKSDLTYARKTAKRSLWQRLAEDVNWVSLSDMWAMVKDSGSDIARMWKRRGEAARNRLGKDITNIIPTGIPYAGRLKYEFERRDRESEEEEVGVWEKGLEKIDSHVLQHDMIPHVRGKEQLKGILNLLAKRGRLDWNDHHLWEKLEYFSSYTMPHKSCERSSILRNQWLQKMIADIWRDTDLFEHWKAENDGAIESGRKHLDPFVEELSAAGALRTELRKLLYNFTKMKNGLPIAKEEEVNPHLYEGLIYYAMRNGKMSMEDKFFYLVRGVEIGLISVDRLRMFSGENFGILNSFPFIDFFSSGQNTTRHEIKAIADKITEKEDPYNPGIKMTKFLMDNVAFDRNVAIRVNKAMKAGQNIDHEDVPQLLTQLDYSGVTNLLSVYSGNQWKISTQGIQNGYVGYNTFLKYFAIKARLGRPPVTSRDISKLVTTLGAYTLWDNIATRQSLGGEIAGRPYLSWNQMEEEPVSRGDKKTKEFRDKMNDFTFNLCRELGISEIRGIDMEDYVGRDRSESTFKKIKEKEKYQTVDDKGNKKFKWSKDSDFYAEVEKGSENFVSQLQAKISARIATDPGFMDRFLSRYAGGDAFIPEQEDFTLEEVSKIWNNGASPQSSGHAGHGTATVPAH